MYTSWNWELGLGSFQKDLTALHFHLFHGRDTVRDVTVSETWANKKTQLCFHGLEQPPNPDLKIDSPVAGNCTALTIVVVHLLSHFLALSNCSAIAQIMECLLHRENELGYVYIKLLCTFLSLCLLLLAGVIQSWLTFRTLWRDAVFCFPETDMWVLQSGGWEAGRVISRC